MFMVVFYSKLNQIKTIQGNATALL